MVEPFYAVSSIKISPLFALHVFFFVFCLFVVVFFFLRNVKIDGTKSCNRKSNSNFL